ncbi:MAG TPA: DUF929 family protein [bacterium]|nr:DUF929 family protein [bacterium]
MWLLPALGVALALVVIWAVVHERRTQGAGGSATPAPRAPIPADIAHNLASIPRGTFDRVGVDDAPPPMLVGAPPSDKRTPVLLYIGAEYCPYCAVMRWPLVAALNRFGTFTGLELSASSATDVFPSTPTLTMVHAKYQSPYIAVQTVELQTNLQDASGQYPPLQRLTATQAALFRHYDPPGNIPFLLIGGQYLLAGSPFSPDVLKGQDWHAIAASLPLGQTPAARAILGTANQISAAICTVDGQAPVAVCQSAGVRDASQTLPRAGK